ncbi:MAG: hypothetical protein KGI47_08715 [Betaproteobacteria bacterium]|nr:hypothetical protein [Betaproteobacteria bacterium]MDE2622537.1 hypothetical protein [Betaproteobacteria bacterium]
MGRPLNMTAQLHDAISAVLANGLSVDLEAEESGASLRIGLRAESDGQGSLLVRYCHGERDGSGHFRAASPGLCGGEHRTIAPFLEAIAGQPDRWLRAPQYALMPEGRFEPSEAWQLLLA